ncbi:MAG: hypothetical protein AAB320_07650 [Elusimicrobiota bacterium]
MSSILVIDDSEHFARMLSRRLGQTGMNCVVACSAEAGLAEARRSPPTRRGRWTRAWTCS